MNSDADYRYPMQYTGSLNLERPTTSPKLTATQKLLKQLDSVESYLDRCEDILSVASAYNIDDEAKEQMMRTLGSIRSKANRLISTDMGFVERLKNTVGNMYRIPDAEWEQPPPGLLRAEGFPRKDIWANPFKKL